MFLEIKENISNTLIENNCSKTIQGMYTLSPAYINFLFLTNHYTLLDCGYLLQILALSKVFN